MIVDVTGIILTPGNHGKDCLGNGSHFGKSGKRIECCCGECDYLICCTEKDISNLCHSCLDLQCPKNSKFLYSYIKERMKIMNLTSDSLNVFIDEMLSRAELRRTKADSYYADLLKKWKTTREALESSMADSNKTTEEIFSLLETYFDLDVKMMAEYDRTIYIQAWADCIRLLTQYGWIDYKDLVLEYK